MLSTTPVEYQGYPSGKWKPCLYERCVVEQMLKEQFGQYVERVRTTDCQAELKRLLAKGPPIYLSDAHALSLEEEGDEYVSRLWFADGNVEQSAQLEGALVGAEREALWEELKSFVIVQGKEEGDDDDDEGDKESNMVT